MIGETPLAPRVWWLRPWAIVIWVLLILPVIGLFGAAAIGSWRPFYAPSEAMAPTLMKGDGFFAAMKGPGDLKRGDVIVFDMRDSSYVKRVAALPGDRIALKGGIVILDGRPVGQHVEGFDRIDFAGRSRRAMRLNERFPGEVRSHRVYDLDYSPLDDFPETIVRPGHVFVLGDNRDQSADSRVPTSQMGVDQLPIGSIRGKVLFYGFFSSRTVGRRI